MKKVLIISYYWPPSGGGGVMRWLKMSKYLPELGWKPIIYTPENPDASVSDESLLQEIHPETEIIKTPIWEPYNLFRRITGKKSDEKFKAGYISEAAQGNWKNKLAVFIRGNFLIPDPRKFWIKPSVKFLTNYLNENPVDLIVSTGPPHSMHLIALGLKKKFDTPWIADFRDPWTGIDFYDKLKLTGPAHKKHRKLELKVLQGADRVVTVSPQWAKDLSKISGRSVEVVQNGFDPEDFINIDEQPYKEFYITHLGALNRDRNPSLFWEILGKIADENPDFRNRLRIHLIGQTDSAAITDIKNNGLSANLILTGHLPHKQGLTELSKSQVLLLPVNNVPGASAILTGKMYEYLAVKRPILAICPEDSVLAEILKKTDAGTAADFNDIDKMRSVIENYFNRFEQGKLQLKSKSVEKYSRKNLAAEFMNIAEELCK